MAMDRVDEGVQELFESFRVVGMGIGRLDVSGSSADLDHGRSHRGMALLCSTERRVGSLPSAQRGVERSFLGVFVARRQPDQLAGQIGPDLWIRRFGQQIKYGHKLT